MADEIKKPEAPKVSEPKKVEAPKAPKTPAPKADPVGNKISPASKTVSKTGGSKFKEISPKHTQYYSSKDGKPSEITKDRAQKWANDVNRPVKVADMNSDNKSLAMPKQWDKSEKANQILADRKKMVEAGFAPKSVNKGNASYDESTGKFTDNNPIREGGIPGFEDSADLWDKMMGSAQKVVDGGKKPEVAKQARDYDYETVRDMAYANGYNPFEHKNGSTEYAKGKIKPEHFDELYDYYAKYREDPKSLSKKDNVRRGYLEGKISEDDYNSFMDSWDRKNNKEPDDYVESWGNVLKEEAKKQDEELAKLLENQKPASDYDDREPKPSQKRSFNSDMVSDYDDDRVEIASSYPSRVRKQAEPSWEPGEGWDRDGYEMTEDADHPVDVSAEDIADYLREQGIELTEYEMQDLVDNNLLPRRIAEEVDFDDEYFKDFVEDRHERQQASKLYRTDLSKKNSK